MRVAALLGLGLSWLSPGMLVSGGCAPRLEPIFEPLEPPLVWPPAPMPARIRYVGQLHSAADLKPPPKPFQALGRLIVGSEEPPELYGPRSVLVSDDGSIVWVADPGGRCLHSLNLATRAYKKRERIRDAQLLTPVGLCRGPAGSIYVCDSESPAIYRLEDKTGTLIESVRIPEDIRRPVAMHYDGTADELFVVDAAAHDVKVLGRGDRLERIIGQRGEAPGEFNFPCDIVGDGETIWIVDAGNHRVQQLTRTGAPLTAFGQAGDGMGDLALPKGIALDSDGHLYVVDARFETVQVFDRRGRLLLFFGQEGTEPGEFWLPAGIFIDSDDRIWICDCYNGRLQVFEYLRAPAAEEPGRREDGAGSRPATRPVEDN